MKLTVVDNYEALSVVGAAIVSDMITAQPDAAIIPATGNTPMGVYRELAAQCALGSLDASRVRIFQLDEYLGTPPGDRRSLYGWLLRSFIQPLAIKEEQVVPLPWDEKDALPGCEAYEQAVAAAGGFDLAILGLGPNGHLGFNEPPSDPDAPTRVVTLTEESIESSARYWGGRQTVPRKAVTAGMAPLLAARQILLLVSGAHKRDILRRTIAGPITPDVPSSYLRRARNVTVLADRDAWPHGDLPA